ncbi:MAG: 2-oxo-4-hydroxy-4-carboxy-5-ureidoimidazoline decarboxylase [Candidatus Obscuribacterales bacterium]|nr:2-oxo-4-hydroxy-4-carboxy-5-ureidoimidazoline decarboxylase [Candidatus Obscuribacterales bacterium]
MQLNRINDLNQPEAHSALFNCCGSASWVEAMLAARPFTDTDELFQKAEIIWSGLKEDDWLEAFKHHPKIGDLDSLRQKFASTRQWAAGEQASVSTASEATLIALKDGNEAYEKKFGFIFIICATGKSAEEMLSLLQLRLNNDKKKELSIAAGEQSKITKIRLEKLCTCQ